MTNPADLLKPEVLQAQGSNLSEAQEEAIREQAIAERTKAVEPERKPKEEEDIEVDPFAVKLDEPKPKAEESGEQTDEEKELAEKAIADEAKAEADALAAIESEKKAKIEEAKKKAEAELTEEDKALLKESTEAQAKARAEEIEKKASDYAIKFGLGDEQAKREVEKIYGFRDKYKDDPTEMAQALYHANAKLSQVSAQLKEVTTKPLPDELVIEGKKLSKEESDEFLVGVYRKNFPDISEDLDDGKVLVLARRELSEKVKQINEKKAIDLRVSAESARKQVIESLPEADKKFAGDLRVALARVADEDMVAEDFDVSDYLRWSRGRHYHQDIKDAEERGFKRATVNKKIVQVRSGETGGSGGGGSAPKGNSGAITLSDEQKERALQMYDGQPLTDAQKYELFIDFEKSKTQLKK